MSYKVYRNLHNGKLSIKNSASGLVVGHCDNVIMFHCDFRVSKKGVERIRRIRQKSVVATVNGDIYKMQGFTPYKGRDVRLYGSDDYSVSAGDPWDKVTFEPYQYDTFVYRDTEKPIYSAKITMLDSIGNIITQ
jgi:hypothetical protein